MNHQIKIIETTDYALLTEVHNLIDEFEKRTEDYYSGRLKGTTQISYVAYINDEPIGYISSYDKYKDGSLYIWMAGIKKRI